MTAIILGLIAALGVGGGLAIANNSGGHHHGNSAASASDVYAAQRAELNARLAALQPDYSLVSTLMDGEHTITLGTESSLFNEYGHTTPTSLALVGTDIQGGYDVSDDDLHRQNGELTGKMYGSDEDVAMVNLRAGRDTIALKSWRPSWNGSLQTEEVNFNFTSADKNVLPVGAPIALNDAYNVFYHEETPVAFTDWNGNGTIHKWTALYLGGEKVGLTVSDFGRWQDNMYTTYESASAEGYHHSTSEKFIFFDEKFAYNPALRTQDQITMSGKVFASESNGYDYAHPKDFLHLYTGDVHFDVNLAANTMTGSVSNMPDARYNIDSFAGTISGSTVKFDGLAYQPTRPFPTEDNRFLGGMGKLLFGKEGIEMVGVLGLQIDIPTEEQRATYMANHGLSTLEGEDLWDFRKDGDSGMVFGAKQD